MSHTIRLYCSYHLFLSQLRGEPNTVLQKQKPEEKSKPGSSAWASPTPQYLINREGQVSQGGF